MSAFNTSMFQSIKDALASSDNKGSATFNEIMQTRPGNTYTVRLLPYAKDPSKTFFHYYNHGWVSYATGQYVQTLSPQTFGDRDPIAEERFRVLRTGTDEEKEKMSAVRRLEKWLVNVYVVDDPSNPENNGKVKLLRYGKQLQKIITEAIEGEDAEEFGARIFDLGDEGVNFKIKVEQQGDYPTYVSSRFTTAGKIDLSEDKQKDIYDNVFELSEVFTLKTFDELKEMLNEHYYCKADEPEVTATAPAEPEPELVTSTATTDTTDTVDDDIDDLLKDL
jgi:hypothetical protein|tara:strand:- start:2745 stop:3578 length:834 start_codon:yes stop_codon:yes gene_type:complete